MSEIIKNKRESLIKIICLDLTSIVLVVLTAELSYSLLDNNYIAEGRGLDMTGLGISFYMMIMISYYFIAITVKAFNVIFPKLKFNLIYRINSILTFAVLGFANLLLYSDTFTVIKVLNEGQLEDVVSNSGVIIPLYTYFIIFLTTTMILIDFKKILLKIEI